MRSGRVPPLSRRDTKRVWLGTATSSARAVTGAGGPLPTPEYDARRTVATTARAGSAVTVTTALPA